MKKINLFAIFLFVALVSLTSCSDDDSANNTPESKYTYKGTDYKMPNGYYNSTSNNSILRKSKDAAAVPSVFYTHTFFLTDAKFLNTDAFTFCNSYGAETKNIIKLDIETTDEKFEKGTFNIVDNDSNNYFYARAYNNITLENGCPNNESFLRIYDGSVEVEKSEDGTFTLTYKLYTDRDKTEENMISGIYYGKPESFKYKSYDY